MNKEKVTLEIKNILKGLGLNFEILFLGEESYPVISLFDDFLFTQCDFDVLDGKTRNLLYKSFIKKGYKIKGSRCFVSNENIQFQLPKPSHTLGSNPADKVLEVLNQNSFTFTTPTQTLLSMAVIGDKRLKKSEFLESFLYKQPSNIQKIRQWVSHDKLDLNLPFSIKQLSEWNNLGINRFRKL